MLSSESATWRLEFSVKDYGLYDWLCVAAEGACCERSRLKRIHYIIVDIAPPKDNFM